jgi:hypothetical protein
MAGPGVVPGAETLEGPGAGIFDGPAVDPEGDALGFNQRSHQPKKNLPVHVAENWIDNGGSRRQVSVICYIVVNRKMSTFCQLN